MSVLVTLSIAVAACGPSSRTERDGVGAASLPKGAVESVAGEPVFASEVEELVSAGLSERSARAHLRRVALLAAAAREDASLVPPREREVARRRAAVQLYLDDLRAAAEPPSDDELRARHEASDDERPFHDAAPALRARLLNERAFSIVLERVVALDEAHPPEVTPEALPALEELEFGDGAP